MTPLQPNDALGVFCFVCILAYMWFRYSAAENPDYAQWVLPVWNEFWHPARGPDPAYSLLSRWWLCVRATVALGLMRAGPDMYAHEVSHWGRHAGTIHAGYYHTDWDMGRGFQELRVSGWRYIVYSDGTL